MKTPTATIHPKPTFEERREHNLRMNRLAKAGGLIAAAKKKRKKSSVPQYLSWFAKLPVTERAAIRKAYEQAKARKVTF